jgi:large subunit ribosomal protein L9
MKVILKQSVPKVGKEGQVVSVKDGFARNYLFPRGMAILADKSQLGVLARRNAKIEAKLAETKAEAESVRDVINGKVVEIAGHVGKDTGRLFGAVTAQDIADAIERQFKVSVDKRAVLLTQPIKRLGDHVVEIDVHRLVDIRLTVRVFDPEAQRPVPEEPAAETQTVEPLAGD